MRYVWLFLLASSVVLGDDQIVLRDGERISAHDYMIGPLYATIGARSIARPSIRAVEREGKAPGDAASLDTVVTASGERLSGHVISATAAEVNLDGKKIAAKEIVEVIFGTGRQGDWAVEISSTGGFTGMGGPHIVATSYGYGGVAEMRAAKGDDMAIPPDELRTIDAAVRAARPEQWKQSYVPAGDNGCCDRMNETFSLQVAGADGKWIVYRTSWYSGNQDRFPADLRAVVKAVMAIRHH